MTLLSTLKPGTRLYDHHTGRERLVQALKRGLLKARVHRSGLFREHLLPGPLSEGLELFPRPSPVRAGADVMPGSLPTAWDQGQTALGALSDIVAAQYGYGSCSKMRWTKPCIWGNHPAVRTS